jgi:hypothetical protein
VEVAIAAKQRAVQLDIPGLAYGPTARNGGHLRAAERHWQDAIAEAGQVALADRSPWQGPVELTIRLAFAPPEELDEGAAGGQGVVEDNSAPRRRGFGRAAARRGPAAACSSFRAVAMERPPYALS